MNLYKFENFIYLYHTRKYVVLPITPDNVTDGKSASFKETNALSRSNPVFSYSNSGARTVNISLDLHRDMVNDANISLRNPDKKDPYKSITVGFSGRNSDTNPFEYNNDDYVDWLIKQLQSIALPNYNTSGKLVIPPMVLLKIGPLVIKGVVSSQIQVTYKKPIMPNGKWAQASLSLTITEIDPYSADYISVNGSYRNITRNALANQHTFYIDQNYHAESSGVKDSPIVRGSSEHFTKA